MRAVFIFNNLKVNTFLLQDQPFPGFELLTWEHESYIHGTLWDIGNDAGYTQIGVSNVHGQLWLAHDMQQMAELEYFIGAKSGLTEAIRSKVHVQDELAVHKIDAIVYRLSQIKSIYTIIPDGKWLIKRSQL
jgi:gamma-glutamylcyclotransferase (GGCT)/AIG2-like uncharacterized protein YtfP